jgi:hypothetical protein
MTPEILSALVGVAVSVGFEKIPGLSSWYNNLDDTKQRLFMLGVLFLVSGVIASLVCTQAGAWLKLPWTCNDAFGVEMLKAFLIAGGFSQATYLITPKKEKTT